MGQNNQGYNIDFGLLTILLSLAAVSCFALYTIQPILPESSSNYFMKQIVWYIAGFIVIVGVMLIDYDRLGQVAWFLYGFGVLLLLGLEFNAPFTKTINGATSWYAFPGMSLQPGEFIKVFLVILQAHLIVRHREKYKRTDIKTDLWLLVKIVGVALVPMALIINQPDLGTFLVVSAITGAMILVSGIRWRILLSILLVIGVFVLGVLIFYTLFPTFTETTLSESGFNHVLERFYGWLQPEQYSGSYGYQLINAMMAIGSGQLYGKGIGGIQSSLRIPERHTDMIFTAISEQFGFIGASIVITLFFLLIYRMIYTALESNDQFGSYLCVGFIGMFTFQVFQNIGMSLQLLPITGIPLPFISYGGSSLITYMLAIGIVFNIRSRTRVYMFD
ncbi:cell division protein FtsW [Pontibacillus halophilus JSM 076056 = DSM 19796]|uniref:Cell division protein FtsW n=1 Tax=Pontibacillus halophilus JSM 076056 = DSM 19796 TaxID=1385510 RepID=A0A0A5GL39_9BACI|nr:FtsW/RodA/SpoVE family cell cycle protein [Pontibacillus halophilus]KGX92709.1 cell division protein FtsW [Pontibacillus halophilus JSM 076056 = DSM 19796]